MAYKKVGWENLPQKTTPLSADNLNHMDEGIAALDGRVTTLEQGGGGSGTGGVGVRSQVGTNNELFNDTSSHTIENTESKNNHLEGSTNKVVKAHKKYANESNHLEGEENIAGGYAGHVENSSNAVYETNAHAGGSRTVASGAGTFSQGRGVISMGLGCAALGQSLYSDGSTTVLGQDGTDTAIDWIIHDDETEQQRSKRIADRLEGLYFGTEPTTGGTGFNESVKGMFLASLGTGNIVGGVNSFARGTANLVEGSNCSSVSSYCFADGFAAHIGKNANNSFLFGNNISIIDGANNSIILNGPNNIARAPHSFITGQGCQTEVGAIDSFLFGNTCYVTAPNTYAFGDHIALGQNRQIGFGKYNNNNSSAIFMIGNGTASSRKNIFEIFDTGKVVAFSYEGKGTNLAIEEVSVPSAATEPENIGFKELLATDYFLNNLTTNTEQGAGSENYGLLGAIDYATKTTFWHSKYDTTNGSPIPNPKLTDGNPYTISLKVDSEMVKTFTGQLLIRFYPRENQDSSSGTWSINPGNFPTDVQIRIGDQTTIFNNLTIKDYAAVDAEANDSFYHDFIVPFGGTLTENSVISFDILKVSGGVSDEYPNGKFACAQGIRFGYAAYSTITKPDIDTSTVGKVAANLKNISDGAYYTTDQLLNMIKANVPSIADNVVTTDDKGNITVKDGATIAPTDTGNGVGKIKFYSSGFGLTITSASNMGIDFDTTGVKLTDNNYKLTSPSTSWTSYELGSDLDNLYNKVKNALTTDKANVANGYAALDSNGNIKIASGQKLYYAEYPETGGIKFIDTAMKLTSPAECGLSIDTVGVDIDFGNNKTYRLGSLGDQIPSDSTGGLMADLKKIFEAQSGTQSQVSAMFSIMATKPVISTAVTSTNTYAVNDNTEYLLIGSGAITGTLTLDFGNVSPLTDSYASYISFETGDTPPTIAINGSHVTVVFKGDDCNSEGNFIPAANKKYEVALKRVGTVDNKPYIVARVGAC